MMKKKLMSSLSVAALAAVLYANAYVRQKIFRNRISEDLQRPVPSRR